MLYLCSQIVSVSSEIQVVHKRKQLLCKDVFGEFLQTCFVWLSLFIIPTNRYSAKTIITVNHRLQWYVPQEHIWTNTVQPAPVILFQTIIYIFSHALEAEQNKSRATRLMNAVPIYSKTLVSLTVNSKESLLLLLDPQAVESLLWLPVVHIQYRLDFIWMQVHQFICFHCSCIVPFSQGLRVAKQRNPMIYFFPSCSAQTRLLSHLVPLSKWIILVMVKGHKTKDQ